jgi:hypothetical protein
LLIVQISDPHVVPSGWLAHGQLDTGRLLERSVATIETLEPQPDAVLIIASDRGVAFRLRLAPLTGSPLRAWEP